MTDLQSEQSRVERPQTLIRRMNLFNHQPESKPFVDRGLFSADEALEMERNTDVLKVEQRDAHVAARSLHRFQSLPLKPDLLFVVFYLAQSISRHHR